jgi:ribosomal protein S18 acetylase RimI-like enzyme
VSGSQLRRLHAPASDMTMQVLRWPGGWARVGPWRARADVAQLAVSTDTPPEGAAIARCLGNLRARGYREVVTSALAPAPAKAFVDAGFHVRERLHLLQHDLRDPPQRGWRTRRAGRHDRERVLAVDSAAFDRVWRLGSDGLDDALHATPVSRFRVLDACTPRGASTPAGYAITGRAGRRGYLQRIAVHPAARGRGLGHDLVADGLHWLLRHYVTLALVNTQLDNDRALALYERCGFRRLPGGLCVLGRML